MPITTKGKLYWLKVHEIPLAEPHRARQGDRQPGAVRRGREAGAGAGRRGVRREPVRVLRHQAGRGEAHRPDARSPTCAPAGIIALGIDEGDELVAVKITDGTKDILLSTAQGMSIRFPETEVRSMGRAAYGVKGITLDDGRRGGGRRRGGEGHHHPHRHRERLRQAHRRRPSTGSRAAAARASSTSRPPSATARSWASCQVKDKDEVMLVTNGGMLIRMKAKEISVIGRNTQGVRLIALESAEREGHRHLQAARVRRVGRGDGAVRRGVHRARGLGRSRGGVFRGAPGVRGRSVRAG